MILGCQRDIGRASPAGLSAFQLRIWSSASTCMTPNPEAFLQALPDSRPSPPRHCQRALQHQFNPSPDVIAGQMISTGP
jgi:hypothetical protein